MKKYIFAIIVISILSITTSAQTLPKENINLATENEIPFKVATGYFVKNTFTKDNLLKSKITTQKEFDEIFGMAALMGENGMPTSINFKNQYVIAVIEKVTDLNTMMTPINLKKISNKLLFKYNKVVNEQQSFTTRPFTMILVDKKYIGKVETFNAQIKTDNLENKALKMLNSQWIIEYFNNPKRSVDTKNCYVTIDVNGGSFTGNDGCNIVNGKVKINENLISFEKISRTLMACDKMEQGNVFVKNLNDVNKYEIKGGELLLYKNNLLIMTLESFR